VSYQPERGEWRFDVEHFSRYGLIDADSDDEEPPPEKEDDGEDWPMPTEDQGSIAMLEGEQCGHLHACAGTYRTDSLDCHVASLQLFAMLPGNAVHMCRITWCSM
jgi:hypothetical protein